jgi:hypothetical protein
VFKSKDFKEIRGADTMQIHTINSKLSEDSLVGVTYKNLLVDNQLKFLSLMFTITLLFKFISIFWYVLLIYPIRIALGYISLAFIGFDLSVLLDHLSLYLHEITT